MKENYKSTSERHDKIALHTAEILQSKKKDIREGLPDS